MKMYERVQDVYFAKQDYITGRLEEEAKGRKIAYLQGKLQGCRHTVAAMREQIGVYDTVIKDVVDIREFGEEALNALAKDLEDNEEMWDSFAVTIKEVLDEKKEFLFYTATSTRELDFTHGFRDGATLYNEVLHSVDEEIERRLEEEPLLAKAMQEID
ncbi:MAG: hypothetical protein DRQ41_14285 [Gammaproteobacteria bacterium]|nr:MAG: hypothetical protein DRQ41_14285 [Gammaproteobacteria bacterium]